MFFSQSPGHLTELARQAVDDGADLLVVVGGDGAFHEVVNGIVGRDVEVALMMRGTGDRKSTRLNSSHLTQSRMPSSA